MGQNKRYFYCFNTIGKFEYIFFPPKSYHIVLLPEKYRNPDCTPTKGILSNHIKNVLLKMITNVSTNETSSKKYRKSS